MAAAAAALIARMLRECVSPSILDILGFRAQDLEADITSATRENDFGDFFCGEGGVYSVPHLFPRHACFLTCLLLLLRRAGPGTSR
eukprot:6329340-Pyramimonas_sp.AAC.2